MNTLKFKIVALTVATGMAASVGSVDVALDAEADDLRRVVLDVQARDAEAMATLLGDKLSVLQSSLQAVAQRVPPAAWHDREAMTRYLVDKPALIPMFESVAAADAQGEPLVRVRRGVAGGTLPNLANEEYFVRAAKSDQPLVSRPFVGPLDKVALVVLAHPVVDADGRHLGVLLGTLPLHSASLFSSSAHERKGLEEVVIDRYGTVLSHTDPAHIMASAAGRPSLRSIVREWLESGAPIDTVAVARRVDGQFVALAGIPGSDWAVVRAADERLALAAVDAARSRGWLVAGLAGLLSSGLAGLLAWAAIRPITRLRERAELLTQDPDAKGVWPREDGEIGRLARAFAGLLAERQRSESASRDLLLQLHAVLDHAQVGITFVRGGVLQFASAELANLLGRPVEQLLGMSVSTLFAEPVALAAHRAEAAAAVDLAGEFDCEVELARADGQRVWCRVRGRALVRGDAPAGAIWTIADVTETRSQHERLSWVATHDALTGLENRVAFEAALQRACADVATTKFVVLFIDLDRFKHVNDTGGHAAGDEMLKRIAAVMLATFRHTDTVARLGGDEFAVLLPDAWAEAAAPFADKLREAIAAVILEWHGQRFDVGASVGLVASDGQALSVEDVLLSADAACYVAKKSGRDQVRVGKVLRHAVLADAVH